MSWLFIITYVLLSGKVTYILFYILVSYIHFVLQVFIEKTEDISTTATYLRLSHILAASLADSVDALTH